MTIDDVNKMFGALKVRITEEFNDDVDQAISALVIGRTLYFFVENKMPISNPKFVKAIRIMADFLDLYSQEVENGKPNS